MRIGHFPFYYQAGAECALIEFYDTILVCMSTVHAYLAITESLASFSEKLMQEECL